MTNIDRGGLAEAATLAARGKHAQASGARHAGPLAADTTLRAVWQRGGWRWVEPRGGVPRCIAETEFGQWPLAAGTRLELVLRLHR